MNAGTCWGKNTIDPSGRGVEKPHKNDFTVFNLNRSYEYCPNVL
jgi:hypothetical protein